MKSRRREGLGKAKDTSTGKPSEPGRGVRVGEGGGVWRMGLDGDHTSLPCSLEIPGPPGLQGSKQLAQGT